MAAAMLVDDPNGCRRSTRGSGRCSVWRGPRVESVTSPGLGRVECDRGLGVGGGRARVPQGGPSAGARGRGCPRAASARALAGTTACRAAHRGGGRLHPDAGHLPWLEEPARVGGGIAHFHSTKQRSGQEAVA
jgi:hypothetical protein